MDHSLHHRPFANDWRQTWLALTAVISAASCASLPSGWDSRGAPPALTDEAFFFAKADSVKAAIENELRAEHFDVETGRGSFDIATRERSFGGRVCADGAPADPA